MHASNTVVLEDNCTKAHVGVPHGDLFTRKLARSLSRLGVSTGLLISATPSAILQMPDIA